jgi:hypothetical protein
MHTLSLFNTFFFFLVTQLLSATKIIVPLYSYPTEPEWATLEASVTQYPNLNFLVVINPDSGPGGSTPEQDFVTGVTMLKSYPNVQVVGYVLTSYNQRDINDVENDVSQYAAWPSEVRVSGIFFDEISEDNIPYYTTAADFVRSSITNGIIVLNPGTTCSSDYFSVVDEIMVYEDSYDAYGGQNVPADGLPKAQSSILIYSMPSDVLEGFVTDLVAAGYGSIYLTDDAATYQTLGDSWDSFCSLMDAAHKGSGSTPPPSLPPPPPPPPTPSKAVPPPVAPPGATPTPTTFKTVVSAQPPPQSSGGSHRHHHHHHHHWD